MDQSNKYRLQNIKMRGKCKQIGQLIQIKVKGTIKIRLKNHTIYNKINLGKLCKIKDQLNKIN